MKNKLKKLFKRYFPTFELYAVIFLTLSFAFISLCVGFYITGLALRFLGFNL